LRKADPQRLVACREGIVAPTPPSRRDRGFLTSLVPCGQA